MPLFTTIPKSIKNPIRVFALSKVLSVNIIAHNDPTAASGIVNIITKGFNSDSNTAARIIYIRIAATPIRK